MLSPKELADFKSMAMKARDGDPFAINFFATIEREKNQRWEEILEVRNTYVVEADSGVRLDPGLLRQLNLGEQQLKDFKEQTFKYAQGDEGAVAFFYGCKVGQMQGSMASGKALTVRNHILAQMGWTMNGSDPIPPAPGAVPTQAAPAAGPEVHHVPQPAPQFEATVADAYAKVQGIHPPPAVSPKLQDTLQQREVQQTSNVAPPIDVRPRVDGRPRVPPPAVMTVPQPSPIDPIGTAPVRVSSGIVDRIPSFDAVGAIETIQEAIDQKRIFAASVVQDMLNEITKLQTKLVSSVTGPMPNGRAPSATA